MGARGAQRPVEPAPVSVAGQDRLRVCPLRLTERRPDAGLDLAASSTFRVRAGGDRGDPPRHADGALAPLFSGTYAVPKLALFPIFIFVFGIGSLSKVALVFLECLYPIVIITSQGARGVDRVLLWSAQNMGASRVEILRRIVVPATAPFIFAGFRVALPVAMIVVVITEMISSADGLGYQVIYALSSLKTDRMLAIVIVIALLGWLLDRTLVVLRDRLVYWEKLETYYV